MKTILNGTLLTLVMIMTGCSQISSNDVDASTIFGELSLNRTEGSTRASVSATFFVGGATGTVVQMDSPASVTINGQGASEQTDPILNMTSYTGTVSTNATLVYTDKTGTSYTNTLLMPGSLSMSTASGTVFISQGFILNYTSSSAFLSDEQLEVTLSGNMGGSVTSFPLITGAVSGSVSISASNLNGISPGPLTIKTCRKLYPKAASPYPKGTTISIQSCANSRTLNLQP